MKRQRGHRRTHRSSFPWSWRTIASVCVVALSVSVLGGCDSTDAFFTPNRVEMELNGLSVDDPQSEELRAEVETVLLALFGDPNSPNFFNQKNTGKKGAGAERKTEDTTTGETGTDQAEADQPATDETAGEESKTNSATSGDVQLSPLRSLIEGETQTPLEMFGFNVRLLQIAAGPAYSDGHGVQQGLYRLHCAHCHGVTGDGNGPTAPFLNPYPRDYRPGKFKFKSTFGSAKPTRADLKRVLKDGIPGTAMPSFVLLPDNEIDALVEYVKYLAVRGEAELRLISYAADEDALPEGGIAEIAGGFPMEMEDGVPTEEPEFENTIASIIYSWDSAVTQVIQPVTPEVPIITQTSDQESQELQDSIDRGRRLFYSAETKCATCHGDSALGDGDLTNVDDWLEAIYKPPGAGPGHEARMLELGALPLRNIRPRNLRLGVFRGGRRPIDLYRRIFSGISGAKMPAQGVDAGIGGDEVSDEQAGGALKRQQIWDLVNYVLSLHYEKLSKPPQDKLGPDFTLR